MGDLTRNFSRHELACRCGCGFGDTHGVWHPVLLKVLQRFRGIARRPVHPNSGARCTNRNKREGGKKYSQHLLLCAVDIRCRVELGDLSPEEAREIARKIPGITGIGIYDTFIHIDTKPGPRREWDERTK